MQTGDARRPDASRPTDYHYHLHKHATYGTSWADYNMQKDFLKN